MAFSFRLPKFSLGGASRGQSIMTGIDIGSELIKIAAIKHVKGKPPVLMTLAATPTPPNSVASGEIIDLQAVGAAITKLAAEHKIPMTRLAFALGNKEVIIKRYDIRREDLPNIDERMKAYAESDLPFEPTEATYRYQILDESAPDALVPVILVAAQHSHTSQREELANSVGTLSVLDIDSYAIFNALTFASPALRGPSIHLHLGFDSSVLLCIDSKGRLQAARDLSVGLAVLRDEYMRLTSADKATATAALGEDGFMEAQRNIGKGWLDALVNDIHRTWAAEHTLGVSAGRPLTVSGGGAVLSDIIRAIANALSASSVTRLDPLQRMEMAPNAIKPTLTADSAGEIGTVALGLAMRMDGLQAPV